MALPYGYRRRGIREVAVRLKVDSSGRVVVPADIRDELGITDEVEAIDTPDGLLLRAPDAPVVSEDDRGLLVVSVGRRVTTEEVRDAVDEDRRHRGG